MSTKLLLYYTDLICEKIDLHLDWFVKRIEVLCRGDFNQAEYIEAMKLQPLDIQINYLVKKALELL